MERGRTNPSVAALQRLTAAYGTSIVELMEGPGEGAGARGLVRAGERLRYDAAAGVVMEQLNFGERAMELHLFTVAPGAGTGGTFRHEGEEFILMVAGRLEVWLDGVERFELGAGDVLYFESTRVHEWRNRGEEPVVFLGVNTPRTF